MHFLKTCDFSDLKKRTVKLDFTSETNYEDQIKQAILKDFPNAFAILLPKDIVSGDFYWFKTVDNLVFVAMADCTGHGVPGAFMSMIGSRLLNEIVNEKKINNNGKRT